MSNNYLEEKIKFVRGMPKSRKGNFENIFFLQFNSVKFVMILVDYFQILK